MISFLDPNWKDTVRVDMSLMRQFDVMCEAEEYMLSDFYQLWDMMESEDVHKSQMLRMWWDSQ